MKIRLLPIILASVLLISGCASSPFLLDQHGLKHKEYPLLVKTKNYEETGFINSNWMIKNWKYEPGFKVWSRKSGKQFEREISIDLDDDGYKEIVKHYYLDLELVNKKNDAKIYFDLMPIPKNKGTLDIGFFLDSYVERNSSNVSWFESDRFSLGSVSEKSYATHVLDKKTFSGDKYEGIVAVVERADLNQLKLNPDHRSDRILVMFIRSNDIHKETISKGNGKVKTKKYPGIISTVLVTKPKYFDEMKADFYLLTESIVLNSDALTIPDLALSE